MTSPLRTPAELAARGTAPAPLPAEIERIVARVRLRARLRAAWLRKLWSEEGAPGGRMAVTDAELATHLEGRDAPALELAWRAADPVAGSWSEELAELERTLDGDTDSRVSRLVRIFGLDAIDVDVLHACLALAVEPALARVYAFLHDHAGRSYVSEELVWRLFDHDLPGAAGPDSALYRWQLVQRTGVAAGEPDLLECDPCVRDWLLDRQRLDETLVDHARPYPPAPPLRDWPVAETAALIHRIVHESGEAVAVQIVGPPASGRRTLAATVAAELGMPLLAVDSTAPDERQWRRLWQRAQRQGFLDGAALAWHGPALGDQGWPRDLPAFPVQFLILSPQAAVPDTGLVEHRLEMPAVGVEERLELWRRYLPASAAWEPEELATLARRHRATVGEIAAAARALPASAAAAAARLRSTARQRLGKLAQPLECPFGWDDLVVSDRLRGVLGDLAYEAEQRTTFWERPEARRLFPQGRGLLALFSGPPGTGKTMAAQVLAASLGFDLFRIDLSAVVSKYVGETSQNLERILSRARHLDLVLLFDEADALFGKRTEIRDAHDRFANTDTNYLLQAIEDYRGVAILATNRRGNLDPAFLRRIRFALDFPKPDAEQRLAIWRRLVGELASVELGGEPGAALDDRLVALAHALELTGAQIKHAVLGALFAARRAGDRLSREHLLHGIDRELMKEGRALSERDLRRLSSDGR